MPAWAVNLLEFDASFFARPSTLSTLGLSDHAILSIAMNNKPSINFSHRPIPKELVSTPL